MNHALNWHDELRSGQLLGYVPRRDANDLLYRQLGFRCGLEVHQQLHTAQKLFCRCPAGHYQRADDYDAQLVRHMRPTLSELGEYDGTALMEFKTRKNIVYRIKGQTACTYDIDDTPPFSLNREALGIALEIAQLLETSIVGEIHITRKQYLDGSIPTGFQRTAIVGIDGAISVDGSRVGIRQLSIEEDSCREVSDIGHERTFSTDRLGMPLVETVTEPELMTPNEAAAAAQYLRYLARSTRRVRVGIGAARQDVNVSITDGTRVEIKGVQHIRWIPELTHNEAFRQKALILIRAILAQRCPDPMQWVAHHRYMATMDVGSPFCALPPEAPVLLVRLPQFGGVLPAFTGPGRTFADELADRLSVIACIERSHMTYRSDPDSPMSEQVWRTIAAGCLAEDQDEIVVVWGPENDLPTALDAIEERCRLAFLGVPSETRKAQPDGTTLFERVLPGPDRMYPDTDSAPIPVTEAMIEESRRSLPGPISSRIQALQAWDIPRDAWSYVLKRDLFDLLSWLIEEEGLPTRFAATLLSHDVRHTLGDADVPREIIRHTVKKAHGMPRDILRVLVPLAVQFPSMTFAELLGRIGYSPHTSGEIRARAEAVRRVSPSHLAIEQRVNWIMGRLRPEALGNVSLATVAQWVRELLA